ncbi:Alpha/Beta hydrolase protein, partial [Obelidium mucronatum]
VLYQIIVVLLTIKGPQRAFLFLNYINFPFGADFSKPESFGFSPHRCRNFHVTTPDGLKLGVWHILPSLFYRQITTLQERSRNIPHGSLITEGIQKRALLERPVFLYFHGNAGNRAAPVRIATYRNLAERLNANVIGFDYRGFGDSEGSPSEEGLAIDARTVYDWIVSQGVPHSQIILLGHSLGSGIATRLARDLGKDKIYPRGLVLQAAYMSIEDAALEYRAFQVLPLLLPITFFPQLEAYMKRTIVDKFRSRDHMPYLNLPVLLIHGRLDREIPCKNSQQLFACAV